MTKTRLLYVDTYIAHANVEELPSSDSLGYGLTSSAALKAALQELGFEITTLRVQAIRRTDWLIAVYREIASRLIQDPPDVVFLFHCFNPFAAEIRRMILDLWAQSTLVGYTHGSHWDPSDTYRTDVYPGLELADLANMAALDLLLLDSATMLRTLQTALADVALPSVRDLLNKAEVVGLPIDLSTIDNYQTDKNPTNQPIIVFNHAPIESKQPQQFARIARRLMVATDVEIRMTRKFGYGVPGAAEFRDLKLRYPKRVRLGDDLPIPVYYKWLWESHFQVSTATHESLGIATLEAMYTGNCTLLPRLGSYPELVGSVDEVLYEPDNTLELEAKLRSLLADEPHRRELGVQLRARAEHYSPARVARRIKRAIRRLGVD